MEGIVLGVSMAPTKVRMVVVEGESADGVTVDQDNFDVDGNARRSGGPSTAPSQVISAILGTRQGATVGGYELLSTGVTWTDHVQAAMLRDALIAHKVENVMLVSAFMAAAALTQAVGDAINYARTALLFVEPYTATLAVVNTSDGSISQVLRRSLADDEDEAVAALAEMASSAEALEARPDGLVVVGSGVDVPLIKPALEAATSLEISVPDEPEMALARGAALASANAPLFASSTVALAYALDPGTGEVDPLALAGQSPGLLPAYLPEYRSVSELAGDAEKAKPNVAYSAVPDENADAQTVIGLDQGVERRKSILLVSSTLAVIFITVVVALEIALAISIRPTVALRPSPNENVIAPAEPKPAPPVQAEPKIQPPRPMTVPHPMNPPAIAPAPAAPLIPVIPPPVFVPVPRVPIVRPPGPGLGADRGPFGVPRGHEPLGGGHGPLGRGPFGGGHGGFGGGHGFGGFGGGHGFGGHGFGGHGFGGHGHR